ncbi:uncharacterized protein PHALS_03796 [Plasmopara halstedii]|uniref:Uncharacterized protein n=1 Tax=Plasmopara halstedii TaxID=4781 RepID=A0A0P1AXG8_PLAHL|nr:uncharacterized protein PHALS_03796 [Plasmopara halstedii]CEG47144.1 hypothetical protein PHALS_03796 [Plasmopara halstedii]|eukprot:XP_024583513.1 hypothetical protein PHALS_03796 [Plasmopara halstedii]
MCSYTNARCCFVQNAMLGDHIPQYLTLQADDTFNKAALISLCKRIGSAAHEEDMPNLYAAVLFGVRAQ